MPALCAKRLKWRAVPQYSNEAEQWWNECQWGFWIRFDLSEDVPYSAAWGEGDSEQFGSLRAAKRWCQDQADAFIRANGCIDARAAQQPR